MDGPPTPADCRLMAKLCRLCGIPHKRHSHATILLQAGEPVHVVSQRLGHASVVVTLTVYAHVLPGDQKRAATRFAELVEVA